MCKMVKVGGPYYLYDSRTLITMWINSYFMLDFSRVLLFKLRVTIQIT